MHMSSFEMLEKPMKQLICFTLVAALFAGCASLNPGEGSAKTPRITHSVFFTLKHPAASPEESAFLAKAAKLATIPGVTNLQVLTEISPKNPYTFGLSMEFATQADYDRYNNHPDHVNFVRDVWMNEVAEFQEIDYVISD